jgi:hypothetical protein
LTSSEDRRYNCIAWAAAENERWWWPDSDSYAYWPRNVPRQSTLDAFIKAFETLGYSKSANGDLDERLEKVAIYADESGEPTHAARQLLSGKWTSKLGELQDIEHEIGMLEGDQYGHVCRFLERPRKQSG